MSSNLAVARERLRQSLSEAQALAAAEGHDMHSFRGSYWEWTAVCRRCGASVTVLAGPGRPSRVSGSALERGCKGKPRTPVR